jgi:hypothetical protein
METFKIDIFLKQDFLVVQNLETQEQKYFTISELSGDLLTSYNAFNSLVDEKTIAEFTQVYVGVQPIKRFVALTVDITTVENIQETLYDNLSDSEKLIFDNFYNTFTSWQ